MPNSRAFRFFALLSVALVLRMIATGLENMGGNASVATKGGSVVLTIGAVACIAWALYVLLRKRQKSDAELVSTFAENVPVEEEIQTTNEIAPPASTMVRRERSTGFGRKIG